MALPWGGDGAPPPAEWPGAVSSKFGDKISGNVICRKQIPTLARDGAEHGVAKVGFGQYFTDSQGLIAPQKKMSVPHLDGGEVCHWRPSKRTLSEPGRLHYEKPEGRGLVAEPPRKVFTMTEKRHIRALESKEEYGDRPVGPKTVYLDSGLRAYDQPAREVDISAEMSRKVRPLDLASQRNGLPARSLGDKAYRHPDYVPGFHATGGLIVGSGFVRGSFARTVPRNAESVQLAFDTTRKHVKSYKEKCMEKQLAAAQSEVQALTRSWEASKLTEWEESKYEDPESDEDERAR